MNAPLRPVRVPDAVVARCGYFLPRLMFLNTRLAPQVHWGDVARALDGFPEESVDLASEPFWIAWMERWVGVARSYEAEAAASTRPAGRAAARRSAAAAYHWAEFMYFSDAATKTALRRAVRDNFVASLDERPVDWRTGGVTVDGVEVPFFLFYPPGAPAAGHPCVICSNGLDSMTEVEVLSLAEPFLERGAAVLLFDGPGQGLSVGLHPLRLDMEAVVAALLAMLAGDPRVAVDRLGFFGVSFGGYFALRIADRLGDAFRCVVNLSGGPVVKPFAGLPRRLKEDFRFAFMGGDESDMQARFDALALAPPPAAGPRVLSIHGGLDDIFPVSALEAYGRASGERHALLVFEGEAHVCLNHIHSAIGRAADWAVDHLSSPQGEM